MANRVVSSAQIRKQLIKAADKLYVDWTIDLNLHFSKPRIYDLATDFNAIREDGWYGCYVIYATDPPRNARIGPSRIQYIGKGRIDARIKSHLSTKPGLRRMTDTIGLKFVAMAWGSLVEPDSPAAWLCEQILLYEHQVMFDGLPKFNKQGPTSEIYAWRRVLRWANPGPKATLARYGS